MIKRFAGQALLVAGCLISSAYAADDAASAGAVAINPEHPTTYVVQPGDTLWGISEKFLVNPWQWPEVWHINEQVANPHLIYPGQTLRLVWQDGKPSLVVDAVAGQAVSSASAVTELKPDGTVKLRPRIREQPYESAIPTIPLENIKAFLNESRVVSLEQLKQAPYLIAGADNRVIMGRGDTIYAREQSPQWNLTYPDYGVYRQGAPYVDPETRELLGYEATRIGSVRAQSTQKDIATMTVVGSREELRVQDKLLLDDPRKVQSAFMPRPAPEGVQARVVTVMGSIAAGARNDVVAINKGEKDQIAPGHVFLVMQKGEMIRDRQRGDIVELPATNSAMVIVFRSFERVSYALVVRSTRPVSRNDLLVSPTRVD